MQSLVFDVGLHNGDDTAYYLSRGYRVVAVEADPDLAAKAEQRFRKEVESGRLTICNVGIAASQGHLPFYICDKHTEWNSFNEAIASRDGMLYHEITIPTCRFRSLLKQYGVPFFLKIDIEGNDFLCLEDLEAGNIPDYISIEGSGGESLHIPERLCELGYRGFKCISQHHQLPLQIPPSPEQLRYERAARRLESHRLRWRVFRKLGGARFLRRQQFATWRRRGWTFPYGSSGPFGEDTPGRWLDFDEFCQTYLEFTRRASRGEPSIFWNRGSYSFWCDIHARRQPPA